MNRPIRHVTVACRLTHQEHRELRKMARVSQETISNVLRRLVLAALTPVGSVQSPAVSATPSEADQETTR